MNSSLCRLWSDYMGVHADHCLHWLQKQIQYIKNSKPYLAKEELELTITLASTQDCPNVWTHLIFMVFLVQNEIRQYYCMKSQARMAIHHKSY